MPCPVRMYRIYGLLPVVLMSVSTCSRADNAYFEPRASIQGFYDDNVGLATTNPRASTGVVVRAAAKTGDSNNRSAVSEPHCEHTAINFAETIEPLFGLAVMTCPL